MDFARQVRLKLWVLVHGERRICATLSDAPGVAASPLTVIEITSDEGDSDAVAALFREWGVEAVVVGVPISLDGSIGPQVNRAAYLCGFRASFRRNSRTRW